VVTVQVALIRLGDFRTPAVLLASTMIGLAVSSVLASFELDLVSSVVQVVAYCILALLVSWLLLHYGGGSEDVISSIDGIASFIFAMVG